MPGLQALLPVSAAIDENGYLAIGGCSTTTLADRFGTPLYVYDEVTLAALPVNRSCRPERQRVHVAGPYCETGDVLIRDIDLPLLRPGDLLAVPVSGAYQLSMASNYNASLRLAVVWIADGQARLVQRRETIANLISRDL